MILNPGLYRTILEHPEDNDARLVYSDWLEENGDANRALFVRTQLAIAVRKPEEMRCTKTGQMTDWHKFTSRCRCSACKLRRWEYETSKRFCVWDWCKGTIGMYVQYRRGFVDCLTVECQKWLISGPYIVHLHPVQSVILTDAIHMREYGGGYERPAIYRNNLGPIFQLACPDAVPSDHFAELQSLEFAEQLVSYNALLWARKEAGLP